MSWQHLSEHAGFCNIQHAHLQHVGVQQLLTRIGSVQAQLQEFQQLATDLQASKEKVQKQHNQKTAALNTKAAEINTLQQSLKRYT